MRKNGAGQAGQALRGSGDFHAWIDSGLYLRSQRDRVLLTAEHRDAPAPAPIELRIASGADGTGTHLEVLDARQVDPAVPKPASSTGDRVLELLQSVSRPLTRLELRSRLRINNQRLGDTLAELEERGAIVRLQHGWASARQAEIEEGWE
jgi:hypothetical protein